MRAGALLLPLWLPVAAAGFGGDTSGGDDRPVVAVTHLEASGAGSLAEALSGGDRRITFTVSGEIVPRRSYLDVTGSHVTVDGASAPPPGITLRGGGLRLRGAEVHDVIVSGIRIRDPRKDGIQIAHGAARIRVDHVSIDGCGDGNIDITHGARDVTVSWSILSGCRKNMLIKYGASRVRLHHNLFVHSRWRNPWVSGRDGAAALAPTLVDIRNNLVWGWGNGGGGTGIEEGAQANLVGNFYSSPGASPRRQGFAILIRGGDAYLAGNRSADDLDFVLDALGTREQLFSTDAPETQDACDAARAVLDAAGVRPPDAVDSRHLGSISLEACDDASTGVDARTR